MAGPIVDSSSLHWKGYEHVSEKLGRLALTLVVRKYHDREPGVFWELRRFLDALGFSNSEGRHVSMKRQLPCLEKRLRWLRLRQQVALRSKPLPGASPWVSARRMLW